MPVLTFFELQVNSQTGTGASKYQNALAVLQWDSEQDSGVTDNSLCISPTKRHGTYLRTYRAPQTNEAVVSAVGCEDNAAPDWPELP